MRPVEAIEVPVADTFHFQCGCEAKMLEHDKVGLAWVEYTEFCWRCRRRHTSTLIGIKKSTLVFYDPILSLLGK